MNIRENKMFDPITGQWVDAESCVVVPDGAKISVPMQFMDSTQRSMAEQTCNVLQDAQDSRDAHYDGMCHALDPSTPFKSDAFNDAPRIPGITVLRQRADDTYERSCRDLQDAYRGNTGEARP